MIEMALMTTIEEVRALVERHRREEETIRVEYERRIDANRRVREAAEVTLQALLAETPVVVGVDADYVSTVTRPSEPAPPSTPVDWKRVLAGLSQTDAMIRIAELSGGVVRTTEAAQIFLSAGITRGNPKHVNGRMFNIMKAGGRFEKIESGSYRLLPADVAGTDETESDG